MMKRRCITAALVVGVACAWSGALAGRVPVSTAFTYQGRLTQAAAPVRGSADLTFQLFDVPTGGVPIGPQVVVNDAPIVDGLFTVELDFLAGAFDGGPRWLAIAVNGTPLTPRQQLTAAPFALHAPAAGGLADAQSASGPGLPLSSTMSFITSPVTVTVGDGQRVHVTATRALGTFSPGGATNLEIAVGYRLSGGGAVQVAGAAMGGLTCAAGMRWPYVVTGVIADLPAGTYEIGMAGRITSGAIGAWDNNGNGSVSALIVP
jgi:hypothetical protein